MKGIQNGVVCVEVYQRFTSIESDIIDEYSGPENLTLWHPHRDCQRSEQALRFDILNFMEDVVGEPSEAII